MDGIGKPRKGKLVRIKGKNEVYWYSEHLPPIFGLYDLEFALLVGHGRNFLENVNILEEVVTYHV